MAKANIEFELDEPHDVAYMNRCLKSTDMACVLFEIEANLKRSIEAKIDSGELIDPSSTLEEIMSSIREIYSEHNIVVEDLIN